MRVTFRTVLGSALVAATCLAIAPRPAAAPPTNTGFERLTARTIDPTGRLRASAPVDLVFERWTTPEETAVFQKALSGSEPHDLLDALHHARVRAGVLEVPGIQQMGARVLARRSRIVWYARDVRTNAGRQIVVGIDEPDVFGENMSRADLLRDTRPPQSVFTLIDIRFGADGPAIGRVGGPDQVAYNPIKKTIELKDFDKATSRLTDIQIRYFLGAPSRQPASVHAGR